MKIHSNILSAFLICSLTSSAFGFSVKSADELDEVQQAANAGVTTLNDFVTKNKAAIASTRSELTTQASALKATNAAITSLIESLKSADANRTAFRKAARDRAAAEVIEALKAADRERVAAEEDYYYQNLDGTAGSVPFVGSQKAAVSSTNALIVEFAKLKEELRSQSNAIEQQIKDIAAKIELLKGQAEKLQRLFRRSNRSYQNFSSLWRKIEMPNKPTPA